MKEAIQALRERIEKAEAKAARAEKALESARVELGDLQTALRVLEDISGVSSSASTAASQNDTVSKRQAAILLVMGFGPKEGRSPAELHSAYTAASQDDISMDTFRTTVWRMKDKLFEANGENVTVRGESGSYWKERAVLALDDFDQMFADDERHKENEPRSELAGGSDAGAEGGPTPSPHRTNPFAIPAG